MTRPAVTPETRADLHRRLDALLDLVERYHPDAGNAPPSAIGRHAASLQAFRTLEAVAKAAQPLLAHAAGLAAAGHDPRDPPPHVDPDATCWSLENVGAGAVPGRPRSELDRAAVRMTLMGALTLAPHVTGAPEVSAIAARDVATMDLGSPPVGLAPRGHAPPPAPTRVETEALLVAGTRALYVAARVLILKEDPRERRRRRPSPRGLVERYLARASACAASGDPGRKAKDRRRALWNRPVPASADGSPLAWDASIDATVEAHLNRVARHFAGEIPAGDLTADERFTAETIEDVLAAFGTTAAAPDDRALVALADVLVEPVVEKNGT